jgi:hypothetical protein
VFRKQTNLDEGAVLAGLIVDDNPAAPRAARSSGTEFRAARLYTEEESAEERSVRVPGGAEAVEDRIEVRLEVRPGDVLHRRDTPPAAIASRADEIALFLGVIICLLLRPVDMVRITDPI